MKRKRHLITAVCIVVGLVMLTTAAVANYDNANGYSAYKSAVKQMLYETNFTCNMTMDLSYNGESLVGAEQLYMYDENGMTSQYSREIGTSGDDAGNASEAWISGGQSVSHYGDKWNIYNAYTKGFLSDVFEDAESKDVFDKTVRVVELLADSFVGDLKNNFVLTDSSENAKSYEVELRGQQIPELVNAVLSLGFTSVKQDYSNSAIRANYVTYRGDEELDDEVWEKAHEELERRGGGVVLIEDDGTFAYYATEQAYEEAIDIPTSASVDIDGILSKFATEPVIESARCELTLDANGRLTHNRIEGTLSGYDADGAKQSFTLAVELEIGDYGTTAIPAPAIPAGAAVRDFTTRD